MAPVPDYRDVDSPEGEAVRSGVMTLAPGATHFDPFGLVTKYSPEQPRDEQGRWTEGIGGSPSTTLSDFDPDADDESTDRDDYGGGHAPPENGPPLHDLLGGSGVEEGEGGWFPDDVYSTLRHYTHATAGTNRYDTESIAVVRAMRGKPDALVTVYRAVPPDVDHINRGDWVAISRAYAEQHAEGMETEVWDPDVEWTLDSGVSGKGSWVPGPPWKVISTTVPARLIRNGGNDIIEWGYWGESTVAKHGSHDQKSHGNWARGGSARASSDLKLKGDFKPGGTSNSRLIDDYLQVHSVDDDTIAAVRDAFEGEWGGLRSQVTNMNGTYDEGNIHVVGIILDENDEQVGDFVRDIFPETGDVSHESLFIAEEFQGRGFAKGFLTQSEAHYRAQGMDSVLVHAVDIGGYAWARAGFDFVDTDGLGNPVPGPPTEGIIAKLEEVASYAKYPIADNQANPYVHHAAGAQSLLDRINTGKHVTAYEIASLGHEGPRFESNVHTGPEGDTIGQYVMIGEEWNGVKDLAAVRKHVHLDDLTDEDWAWIERAMVEGRVRKYSPSQPRDQRGRWTDGTGTGVIHGAKPEWSPTMTRDDAEHWAMDSKIQDVLTHTTAAGNLHAPTLDDGKGDMVWVGDGPAEGGKWVPRAHAAQTMSGGWVLKPEALTNGILDSGFRPGDGVFGDGIYLGAEELVEDQEYPEGWDRERFEQDDSSFPGMHQALHDEQAHNYAYGSSLEATPTLRVKVDVRNPFVTEFIGGETYSASETKVKERVADQHPEYPDYSAPLNKILTDLGYDALVIRHPGPFEWNIGGDQVVIWDPKQVTVLVDENGNPEPYRYRKSRGRRGRITVLKHGGSSHDQSTHGNWARGEAWIRENFEPVDILPRSGGYAMLRDGSIYKVGMHEDSGLAGAAALGLNSAQSRGVGFFTHDAGAVRIRTVNDEIVVEAGTAPLTGAQRRRLVEEADGRNWSVMDNRGNSTGLLFQPEPSRLGAALQPFLKYSPSQPRDNRGRWTDGTGTVHTGDIDTAVTALGEGHNVHLDEARKVTVLLDRLREVVAEAKRLGKKAPTYDLCKVTVPGTNIFCGDSKDIPRAQMPQLKGVPTPGSRADSLPRDSRGEVSLNDEFRRHLISTGVVVSDANLPAAWLKATQRELNGAKVAEIAKAYREGQLARERLFVTRDGYIIDGHHRWASILGTDLADNVSGDHLMEVAQIAMPVLDVIAEANKFAADWGIPQAGLTSGFSPTMKAGVAVLHPFAKHGGASHDQKSHGNRGGRSNTGLDNISASDATARLSTTFPKAHVSGMDLLEPAAREGVVRGFERMMKEFPEMADRVALVRAGPGLETTDGIAEHIITTVRKPDGSLQTGHGFLFNAEKMNSGDATSESYNGILSAVEDGAWGVQRDGVWSMRSNVMSIDSHAAYAESNAVHEFGHAVHNLSTSKGLNKPSWDKDGLPDPHVWEDAAIPGRVAGGSDPDNLALDDYKTKNATADGPVSPPPSMYAGSGHIGELFAEAFLFRHGPAGVGLMQRKSLDPELERIVAKIEQDAKA